MSPRRPAPARPGVRPGTRPAARPQRPGTHAPLTRDTAGAGTAKNPQSLTSAPISTQPPPQPANRSPRSPEEERIARHERMMMRMGGSNGIGVSVRILAIAVVLLFAFVITFPALRGYLAQRAQYDAITSQLAEAKATSTSLEAELARWQDDDYVRAQARQRLFYVMPGETTYVVVGADQVEQRASQKAELDKNATTSPWYEVLRESAKIAGRTATVTTGGEPAQQGWATNAPSEEASQTPTADAGTSEPTTEATTEPTSH